MEENPGEGQPAGKTERQRRISVYARQAFSWACRVSSVSSVCVFISVCVFWCLCAPVPGCISVYDSAVISQGEEPVQVQTAYLPFACIHSF